MDSDIRIEIFRPGTFTSLEGTVVTFGDADLRAIADAYDPATNPAPIVIGHPELDAPAYGWVDRLEYAGDRLVAVPKDVDPSFAETVKAGRYRQVSARFYPKGAANSPHPAAAYLKHVGFLGAAAPAVKGLKPVSFSQDELANTLTIDLPAPSKEPAVAEDAPKQPDTQSFAELTSEVASLKKQIADRDAAAIAAGKVAAHDAAVSFADGLIADGKLAPAGKGLVVGLLEGLDATAAVSFGEGDANKLTPAAAFRKLFEGAKPVISFGELVKRGDEPDGAIDANALAAEAVSFCDAEEKAGRRRPSATEAVAHVQRAKKVAA